MTCENEGRGENIKEERRETEREVESGEARNGEGSEKSERRRVNEKRK